MFVCGRNQQGQLGIGKNSKDSNLTMVESLKNVKIEKVFFEEYHTIFLERKCNFDWKSKDFFTDIIFLIEIIK